MVQVRLALSRLAKRAVPAIGVAGLATVVLTVTPLEVPPAVASTVYYAYVANNGSKTMESTHGSVSVIDTSTKTVVSTVHKGVKEGAGGIAITPNGAYAYVSVGSYSHTVSVIDTSTNMVVSTVDVGNSPDGVAITPNGSYAYVANTESGTVSVIDTSTNTVMSTVDVGTYPEGVAITPDGSYAFVTNNGSNTVSVIDTSTNTVTSTV